MEESLNLPSNLRYAAALRYAPRGTCEKSKESLKWRDALKNDPGKVVKYTKDRFEKTRLFVDDYLRPDRLLVPVPRSYPTPDNRHWPGLQLCVHLHNEGLGGPVMGLLERTERVAKSAFAQAGERPNAKRHYETIAAHTSTLPVEKITVVDDIITKGNTLTACYALLREAYPEADIKLFAMARARGFDRTLETIWFPFEGELSFRNGESNRTD